MRKQDAFPEKVEDAGRKILELFRNEQVEDDVAFTTLFLLASFCFASQISDLPADERRRAAKMIGREFSALVRRWVRVFFEEQIAEEKDEAGQCYQENEGSWVKNF